MVVRRNGMGGVVMLILSPVLVLLALLLPTPARADLFFSEYVEGSSNSKALEIYNGTGSSINLTDGNYVIAIYANGSASPGSPITLSGTVANGGVFVVAHSSADPAIIARANQTSGKISFTGNDAVALLKNGEIIDVIGQIGFDPGTEWGSGLTSTADNTLRRKSTVIVGDTNGADAFDPSIEWEGFAMNAFDGLGTHEVASSVPLPAAVWFFGPGLIGLIGIKRRIKGSAVSFEPSANHLQRHTGGIKA